MAPFTDRDDQPVCLERSDRGCHRQSYNVVYGYVGTSGGKLALEEDRPVWASAGLHHVAGTWALGDDLTGRTAVVTPRLGVAKVECLQFGDCLRTGLAHERWDPIPGQTGLTSWTTTADHR